MDIKTFRSSKNLTQPQMATAIGIDQGLLSRHENGKVLPSEDVIALYEAFSEGLITANDFHRVRAEYKAKRSMEEARSC